MTRALSTPPVISSGSLSGFPQPVLPVAQGLLLRPWEPADAPAFLSAYADGEIRRWHTRRPRTEADVQEWFDAYRQDWKHEKGGHWAVARDDGEVLGRIALRGFNFDDGVAVVAYWVLPAARGAGVATCAVTALSVWALTADTACTCTPAPGRPETARWSTITQIYEGNNQVQRMVMAWQLVNHVNSMLTVLYVDAPWRFL
jgi:hypothetical protein